MPAPRSQQSPMRRSIVTLGVSFLMFGACEPAAQPPPRTPVAVASASSSATPVASASASTPPPPPPDPLAAVKARGTIVAGPFPLPGVADHKSVVFLGEGNAAQVAWLEDTTGKFRPIEIPTAVKVRDVFVDAGQAYVIFESLAALDQPAGLVGAWTLREDGAFTTEMLWEIRHEISPKSIAAAALARKAPEPTNLEAERKKLLVAASKSVDALGKHLVKGGVDVLEQFQGAFVRATEHVDDKGFAKHARAKQMLALVQALVKDSYCFDLTCQAGTAAVLFERDAKGQLHVGAFLDLGAPPATGAATAAAKKAPKEKKHKKGKHAPKSAPPLAAPVPKNKPLPVAAHDDPKATLAAAMRLSDAKVTVLSEAPLRGAAGTIGVVTLDQDPTPWLVITDGPYARMLPAHAMSCCGEEAWQFEARFVDANADGATDVLIRRTRGKEAAKPEKHALLLLGPRSVNQRDVFADARFSLALLQAPTLDAQLAAVVAFEDPKVTEAEACKVAGTLGTLKGFRAAAAKDTVVLQFDEPFQPTLHPIVTPADKVDKNMLSKVGCSEMRCVGGACVTDVDGPGSTHLWFRREPKGLKLAGVAFYVGS